MTTHDFLYGEPGDELMSSDPVDVFENWHDADHPEPEPIVIEKWSVHSPASHLPDLDRVLDYVTEQAVDGNGDEAYDENWNQAAAEDDVRAAFRAALDLLASHVTYRMADQKVGEHVITWAEDGTVLLDGQPMATPTEPATATEVPA